MNDGCSCCRQQIEDLEGKVKISKEQVKKKEENETKYQGEGSEERNS